MKDAIPNESPLGGKTALDGARGEKLAVSASDLADQPWDVVVIGAGTGGATAAIQLAQQGRRVLLVEAKAFPRDKVCGGCLNQRAWMGLQQIESCGRSAAQRVQSAGSVPLDRMRLHCVDQSAEWNLPQMHAISRRRLDSVLVEMAIESGVVFCCDSPAKVIADDAADFRTILLGKAGQLGKTGTTNSKVFARVVIAADGLGHPSLSELNETIGNQVSPRARIGMGATLRLCAPEYREKVLTMAVGKPGYVGLAPVEDQQLNMAAAIDAYALKTSGPHAVVLQILEQCKLPVPQGLENAKWTGTLPLTRSSRSVAARRLFVIGDAASYVEPFTGEGMSWSISDAIQLSDLLRGVDLAHYDALSAAWSRHWMRGKHRKQWICRALTELLRHPRMASYSLVAARWLPWIPHWLISRASGEVRFGAVG